MNTLVVLFALASVACASWVPLAQPPHHPALVLDPHGRPLDTAEVINARALHLQAKALDGHYEHAAVIAPAVGVARAVVAAPAAVSHQSRVDVISSPSIVSHTVSAPVLAHASPLLAYSGYGYADHGHYLHKRSLGHYAYAAPALVAAPSAVSHQSRVDVISNPAVVSHAVAAPVLAHAAPVVAVAPAAVSHQSRVDVRTSPAIVSHAAIAPIQYANLYSGHSAWAAPSYGAHAYSYGGHGYDHLLKKRSLGHYLTPVAYSVPSAVSHQSRVDVRTSPAIVSHAAIAPIQYANLYSGHSAWAAPSYGAHAYSYGGHGYDHLLKKRSLGHYLSPIAYSVPSAVSHQSRVDVISKPAVVSTHITPAVYSAPSVYAAPAVSHYAPISHSAIWSAPLALKAAHW